MDSIQMWFSSSSDEETPNTDIERRSLRISSDIFALSDARFKQYFRLPKEAFKHVLSNILPELKKGIRSTAVAPNIKLGVALRILAEGSYQTGAGNDFNIALSQATTSVCFEEVINAIEKILCPKYINFSNVSEQEKVQTKVYFFEKFGIPGIVGCIDGTHLRIIAPSQSVQNLYLNRKGYYSLNAMIVCDHEMKILYFDARHPGSSHDSLIWNTSDLRELMQEKYNNGDRNSWLLGDAGYPLEHYLMTPFRSTIEGSLQAKYNAIHAKARNVVERTIGVLKNRFRCLLGERQMHYSPDKAKKIANACVALHNICIHFNCHTEEETVDSAESNEQQDHISVPDNLEAAGVRMQIMQSLN